MFANSSWQEKEKDTARQIPRKLCKESRGLDGEQEVILPEEIGPLEGKCLMKIEVHVYKALEVSTL